MLPSAFSPVPSHHSSTHPELPIQERFLLGHLLPVKLRTKKEEDASSPTPSQGPWNSGKGSDGRSPAQPSPCLLHPAPNVVPKLPKAKKAFYFSIMYLSPKHKAILLLLPPHLMGRSSGPLIPIVAPLTHPCRASAAGHQSCPFLLPGPWLRGPVGRIPKPSGLKSEPNQP